MATPTTAPPLCDPWEMALIHRLIRRGIEQSRDFVLEPGAASRSADVSAYVAFHLAGLSAHHSTEDDNIWPVLHQRAAVSDALISRMEEQHAGLHDALDSTHAALAAWTDSPDEASASALAAALTGVLDGLAEHLTEEERDVVPLIATHITQEEWERAGKAAFDKFTPKQRFVAMGEMLTTATPEEAARMMAGLPAPVKVLWRVFGRRGYVRFMSAVRGHGS